MAWRRKIGKPNGIMAASWRSYGGINSGEILASVSVRRGISVTWRTHRTFLLACALLFTRLCCARRCVTRTYAPLTLASFCRRARLVWRAALHGVIGGAARKLISSSGVIGSRWRRSHNRQASSTWHSASISAASVAAYQRNIGSSIKRAARARINAHNARCCCACARCAPAHTPLLPLRRASRRARALSHRALLFTRAVPPYVPHARACAPRA